MITNCSKDVEKIETETECGISLLRSDSTIIIVGKEEENVAEANIPEPKLPETPTEKMDLPAQPGKQKTLWD